MPSVIAPAAAAAPDEGETGGAQRGRVGPVRGPIVATVRRVLYPSLAAQSLTFSAAVLQGGGAENQAAYSAHYVSDP